jgi:hypothetical protein
MIDMNRLRVLIFISLVCFLPYSGVAIQTVHSQDGVFIDSNQNLGSLNSSGVALGDVDGDGDSDVFVANGAWLAGGQVNKVWLNDGNGSFSDSGQDLGNSGSFSVALGDLDGDNDLDALIANHPGSTKVWLNDGSGNFADSGQALGSSTFSAALGDVDSDGDLDAFVIPGTGPAKIWLNDGSGSFADSGQSLGAGVIYSWDVSLGDLDSDGDLDAFIATGNFQGLANKVWLNDGSGNYTDSGQALGNSDSRGVSLGDLDNDGDLDAFIANRTLADKVWLNDGNGTFTDSGQNLGELNNSNSNDVTLGDLDNDGDLDAFTANEPFANKVWLNDGNGNFADSGQLIGLSQSLSLALWDLDNDGDLDVFNTNYGANKVYLNTTALPATYDATGSWTYSMNNNWVDPGVCFAQANETRNSNFTQNGNKVTIVVDGINYNGYVREVTYTATSTYLVLDGTVTTNLSFTLSSRTTGSGSVNWYWTDGQDSCLGGSDISITGQGNVNSGGGGGGGGCFISTFLK